MSLENYMREVFPDLKLRPPLFYNWETSIRFELGVNYDPISIDGHRQYLEGVYKRAITLFKAIHADRDELYIVVDVNDFEDGQTFKRKLNFFSKYIKEKSVLYTLQEKTIPYIFPADDEEGIYRTHRFILKCKRTDIKYITMLKAICHHDLGIRSSVFHRVYFINRTKNTIFHIYDDRGCDFLATSPDTIRNIYTTYNEWILDYDRPEIDRIFKSRI